MIVIPMQRDVRYAQAAERATTFGRELPTAAHDAPPGSAARPVPESASESTPESAPESASESAPDPSGGRGPRRVDETAPETGEAA